MYFYFKLLLKLYPDAGYHAEHSNFYVVHLFMLPNYENISVHSNKHFFFEVTHISLTCMSLIMAEKKTLYPDSKT